MMIKALSLCLALLLAGPVQAAQTFTRVYRAPAPIRTNTGLPVQLNLKLSAPLTQVNGLPFLTPSIHAKPGVTIVNPAETVVLQAPGAQTGELAGGEVLAPMAQLDQAGKLAELGRSDEGGSSSESSGAAWSGYWQGAKTESKTGVVAKTGGKRQVLSKGSKNNDGGMGKTALLGGAGMISLQGGLETFRQGLETASPYLELGGLAFLASWVIKPAAKMIEKFGARRGWKNGTVRGAKTLTGVLTAAALLTLPLTLPAVWAAVAPFSGALAVIGMVRMADAAVGRSMDPKKAVTLGVKAALWAVGAGVALEAAGFPVDMVLTGLWGMVSPYTPFVGAVAGTYAVSRAVKWGIDRIAEKAGWQPNTKVVVKLIANIVVWTGGAAMGLSAAGVSTKTLMTTFGIGGIAVTLAAKDFIGNFMEAMKILLLKPYVVGDKIKIGEDEYTVKGMSLRYLELEGAPDKLTLMTYAQIADKAITIKRPYTVKGKRFFAGGVKPVTFSDLWRSSGFTRVAPKLHMGKAALLAGVGLAVVFGLPVVAASTAVSLPWLMAALPYIKTLGALWATRWASQWLTGLVTKLGELAQWDPQAATVVKFMAQALTWTIGGTIGLHMAGITWGALLTAVGASSIALGWASADLLGNLIQGTWILATQPFKIGESIEIGKNKGRIVDMGVHYIVLENEEKTGALREDFVPGGTEHTLVPYGVVKASAFTVAAPKENIK